MLDGGLKSCCRFAIDGDSTHRGRSDLVKDPSRPKDSRDPLPQLGVNPICRSVFSQRYRLTQPAGGGHVPLADASG